MEVPGGTNRKLTVTIYEMFGTALFVYGILVSSGNAIAVPLSLFASIIIFGGITGGHFNPAVSLGVFINCENRRDKIVFLIIIMIAQCVGAFLAIGMAWLSLFAKDSNHKLVVETPPYVCPVDVYEVVEGDKMVEKQDCDNTDGKGFSYDF